jgi:RHS repeat-associated protein
MTDTVTYSVGAPGVGVLTLNVYYGSGYSWGTYNVTALGPRPVVQVLERFQGTRQVTKCVADCFDALVGYGTRPYYSQDMPHSIQLVYRSSVAYPMAFVSVGAWDTSSVHPRKMSLRLKRSDGTFVTFTNGLTETFFACDSAGGYIACDSSSNRLAAQFNASSMSTGLSYYTVLVRTYRADESFFETQDSVYLLVENQANSPFGAGWMMAGYQRLYTVSTSLVITDGNGSIGYFRTNSPPSCTTCNYISPAGDFTSVTKQPVDSWGATYTRRYPDGVKVGFRSDGLMVYLQDAFGNTRLWRYNASTQLAAIRDVVGKDDSLGYVAGRLRWIKDPGGRVDSFTVDASGNLTRIRDAVGGIPFQGVYDTFHRLTHWTDRRGGGWGMAYDFASKLKADTAPAIATVHGSGERPVVRYVSLEAATLTDTALHLGTSTNPAPGIDARFIRAKVTNARGVVISFALNLFRQATRVEAPLGRTARFTFDTAGRRTIDSLPEGLGHILRYTWSGPNMTQFKDSTTGRTINYVYSATYNLLKLMWGDVDSVLNVLHGGDGAYADSTHVGGASDWSYFTNFGAQCRFIGSPPGPDPYWSTCAFPGSTGFKNTDSVQVRRKVPPYGPYAWTFYQYDTYGQRVRTINPVKDTMWTQYDPLGRVKAVIGARHDTTSYTYDSLFLTQVRDARGQIYKVWRNALGWPDSTMDPAGRLARFTYDSGGNVVNIVNRRGQSVQSVYDSLDQIRMRIVGADTTRYFSDPLGRYRTVANRESTDTLKMDDAGRPAVQVTCRVLVSGSAPQCFRDSSVYEIRDLRTKQMITAPGLWTTHTASYHYDNHMLLDTLTNFTGEKQAFTYGRQLHDSTRKFLALSNLTATYGRRISPWTQGFASLSFSDPSLTNAVGISTSYDTLSRITAHFHGDPATPDTVRSFVHTAAGVAAFGDTAYSWISPACTLGILLGESCDYSKVQSKTDGGHAGVFYYDSVGNRKDTPTQTYGVDPGNRVRRFANIRLDFDFDGNVTRKRVLFHSDTSIVVRTDSLFWSATGLLDSLHSRDGSGTLTVRVSYGYDGWGRQVRQSTSAATLRYLWDGDNRIFMLDTLGARIAYWTFFPGSTEPQSVAFTGCCGADTTLYFVTDALHNNVAMLKSNAGTYQLHNQFRYGPYGDSLSVTGTGSNMIRLRYKGAFYDDQARLYQMGIRFFDPDVGRFVSEDPLGLGGGINQYAFAGDDPVNGYDPSGECPWCLAILFTVAVNYVASQISDAMSVSFAQGPCDKGPKPKGPPPPVAGVAFQQDDCGAIRGGSSAGLNSLLAMAVAQYLILMSKVRRHVVVPGTPICAGLQGEGTYGVADVTGRYVEGVGGGVGFGVLRGSGGWVLFLKGEFLVGLDAGVSTGFGYWRGTGDSFFGASWVGNGNVGPVSGSASGNGGGSGTTVGPAAEAGASAGVSLAVPIYQVCR